MNITIRHNAVRHKYIHTFIHTFIVLAMMNVAIWRVAMMYDINTAKHNVIHLELYQRNVAICRVTVV